jgi:hypothetical protein
MIAAPETWTDSDGEITVDVRAGPEDDGLMISVESDDLGVLEWVIVPAAAIEWLRGALARARVRS